MLPIIVTQYFPVAYVPGSLTSQLVNHIKNSKEEDVLTSTIEFLTDFIEDWPMIATDDGEELQDTENIEIISIDEVGAVIACGGDWQEPMKICITCDLTGQRRVWKADFDEFPDNGLTSEDILKIIELWEKK